MNTSEELQDELPLFFSTLARDYAPEQRTTFLQHVTCSRFSYPRNHSGHDEPRALLDVYARFSTHARLRLLESAHEHRARSRELRRLGEVVAEITLAKPGWDGGT